MAPDAGSEDVGMEKDDSLKRRGSLLSVLVLAIVLAVIVWLLMQFLGLGGGAPGKVTGPTRSVSSTVPVAPPEAEVPDAPLIIEPSADNPVVPDVTGDTQKSAVLELQAAGYVADLIYVYSDSAAASVVIRQNPSAGVVLQAGGVVGLIVSRGNGQTPQVVMPDVIGLTKSAAIEKVKAAGLKPYVLLGTNQTYAGRVGDQWPLGGTKLPKGSEGFVQVMIAQ